MRYSHLSSEHLREAVSNPEKTLIHGDKREGRYENIS